MASYDLPSAILWTSGADALGSLSVGATEFVSYVRTSTGIAMASYDLATGNELWHDEADPSVDQSEMVAPLIEYDGHSWTAYLTPQAGDLVGLKVVDARTGVPVTLTSQALWATTRPSICKKVKTSFCFTGNSTKDTNLWRQPGHVDPVTGRVSVGGEPEVPVAGASLRGEHVYTRWGQGKSPDDLGYVLDGAVRWRRLYAEVFGPDSSSADGSWWIDASDRSVIVGSSLSLQPTYKSAEVNGSAVLNLATAGKVVGLDPATGATLWSLAGAGVCDHLGKIPYLSSATVLPVCRFSRGTMTVATNASTGLAVPTYSDVGYELVGVDVTTGRVLWTVPMHPDAFLQFLHGAPYSLSASSTTTIVNLSPARQWELVDLATGKVKQATSTTVMACVNPRKSVQVKGRQTVYPGGRAGYACRADLSPSDSWSSAAARDVGSSASNGTVWIISGETGFVAVKVL